MNIPNSKARLKEECSIRAVKFVQYITVMSRLFTWDVETILTGGRETGSSDRYYP